MRWAREPGVPLAESSQPGCWGAYGGGLEPGCLGLDPLPLILIQSMASSKLFIIFQALGVPIMKEAPISPS